MFLLQNPDGSGMNYLVEFQHDQNMKGQVRALTTCKIFSGEAETPRDLCQGDPMVGVAKTSKSDVFCKATGRKIALARALKNAFPGDRATRELFWQKYFITTHGQTIPPSPWVKRWKRYQEKQG